MKEAAKLYRELLKGIEKQMGNNTKKTFHLRKLIRHQFRSNSNLSDPTAIQKRLNLARDYASALKEGGDI